jgi:hypothetical protein
MQTNKLNTRFQKQLFVICLTLFSTTSLYSNPWATGLGVVSDLVSLGGALVGKTTLSPAYAVHMWRNDYYGYYANKPFAHHGRVDRDPILGSIEFYKKYQLSDGSVRESKDQFPINFLRRRNFSCNRSTTDSTGSLTKDIVNELEDFSIILWHNTPPQKSGVFPPGQPYKFLVRTEGEIITQNCNVIQPFTRIWEATGTIGDYGSFITKLPGVNYQYAWPPLVWGEEK